MRYVAAYCLAALSGSEPSAKDIEKVLGSVGIDCDAASAKKVVQQLKGKNLQEIITEGKGKLGSMPMASGPPGGGGGGGSGGGSAAPADTAAPPPKEEKKEESEEESDEDMGFGLFD